jgi:hypothetical protein
MKSAVVMLLSASVCGARLENRALRDFLASDDGGQ